jgi:hypothetical protein
MSARVFYTYMATMRDCLAACAAPKKPVLVLDRPNLGAISPEGRSPTRTDLLTSSAAVPARRHDLRRLASFPNDAQRSGSNCMVRSTAGNLMFNGVIARRRLPRIIPVLYVGMRLFEATNLNRRAPAPKHRSIFVSAWLDPDGVC